MAGFKVDHEGFLQMAGKLYVPDVDGLRKEVRIEGHHSKLTIHLGGNKMYGDFKQIFYWEGRREIFATLFQGV